MLLHVDGLSALSGAGADSGPRSGVGARRVDGVDLHIAAGETCECRRIGFGNRSGRLVLSFPNRRGPSALRRLRLGLLDAAALRAQRRARQIIFHDHYSSLHPRMTWARRSPNR